MKRIFKVVFLLMIIALIGIINCSNFSIAENTRSGYHDVDTKTNFTVGDLKFYDISFADYSNTSTQAFGIYGYIESKFDGNVLYDATACYYDSNYSLLTVYSNTGTARAGSNYFNMMSNLDILNGISPSQIAYYELFVNIKNTYQYPASNYDYDDDSSYDYSTSAGYTINKYDIDMTVNENNTFDIIETITADFSVSKHGIFRTIPITNKITRLDKTTSKNHAQLLNIEVDDYEYSVSRESDKMIIKIGSSDKVLTGEHTYVIKYKYNIGKDPMKDYDELYYNLIGNEWDTSISNITFKITMPKEFEASKLGFSSGYFGETENDNIEFNVDGKVIEGKYNGTLAAGNAITVRCELPEGYFQGAGYILEPATVILFSIPLIVLIIVFIIWWLFAREKMIVDAVEYYPPEELNSLDLAFYYRGKATKNDVVSLLIDLANKGYITISENNSKNSSKNDKKVHVKLNNEKVEELKKKLEEEKVANPESNKIPYYEKMLNLYSDIDKPVDFEGLGLKKEADSFNKKNAGKFTITKVKDYDGNNKCEKWFMAGLFGTKKTTATEKTLKNKFYTTIEKILASVNQGANRKKIMAKGTGISKFIIMALAIITYVYITIVVLSLYGNIEMAIVALIFPPIGLGVIIATFIKGGIAEKIFSLIWGGLFGGAPFVLSVGTALITDPGCLVGYTIGVIAIILMIVIYTKCNRRTELGRKTLGKIMGFKRFLETAEKNELEAMVEKNPTYFYDILPYAYVLGISDKWISKFETIAVQEPNWYSSNSSFDMYTFGSFMNHTMSSATSAMTSSPSSSGSGGGSSSGGSSGGGSSGGGSGGGGGGSW